MKYLFFDIDGTLVSHDHGLIPSAKKAIGRSRQKGNLCFLATGRHLSSLWAVKDLDMDELDFWDLVMDIEDTFSVEVDDDIDWTKETVGSMVKFIEENI